MPKKIFKEPSIRKKGQGLFINRALFPDFEKVLKNWVIEQRTFGAIVDGKPIQKKALEFFKELLPERDLDNSEVQDSRLQEDSGLQKEHETPGESKESFVASRGWLKNF